MEFSPGNAVILIVTGLVAGIINTLAGGGSNLTLPALMVMGLPADIANATNRVSVVLQTMVATRGFIRHDKLPTADLPAILVPVLLGSLAGAMIASYAPTDYLKPMLLTAMIGMTVLMLVKPEFASLGADTTPEQLQQHPRAWLGLFLTGCYGGFVQAGVGFLLLAMLAGTLRYDLVRANAIKVVCAFVMTSLALFVFVLRDQVLWLPGLLLALGSMVGAHLAVKFAIRAKPSTLKWFLLVMTICGSAAALYMD